MNDSIPNETGIQIDARSLIAAEVVRGAVVGFVCSLLVAVPVGFILGKEPMIGASGAVAVGALIVFAGACLPALVCAFVGRELILTDEQRAIIRRHRRRAFTITNYVLTPLAILLLVGCYFSGMYMLIAPAICLKWTCLIVASLVGRANGRAVVAEMQRSASATAGSAGGRWEDRRPAPSFAADPERERVRLSDRERLADARQRAGEATSFGERGEED
jgi:hypothetical protein